MKNFERWLLLLSIFSLVQISCTGVPAGTSQARNRDDLSITNFNSEFDAKKAFENHNTTCKNPESCSESTATMVSLFEKTNLGRCTAALVAKDIVVTNAHCIPVEIQNNSNLCAGQIKFLFPETKNFSKSEIACGSIIGFVNPDNTTNGIDLAYIKLKSPTTRPILLVDISGIQNDEELLISKSNPVDDFKSELEYSSCLAKQNSTVASRFVDRISRTFALGDCKIVHGNSGSPLISESGRVKGIISYTIPPKEEGKLPAAGGTNFACAPFPGGNNPNSIQPNCEVTANNTLQEQVNGSFTTKLFSSSLSLKSLISEYVQGFFELKKLQGIRWKFTASVLKNQGADTIWWLKPVPVCFTNRGVLLSGEADQNTNLKQKTELQIASNILTISIGSNEFYQPQFKTKKENLHSPLILKYSPLALSLYNQTPLALNDENFHLQRCPSNESGYELDLKLLSEIFLRINLINNIK